MFSGIVESASVEKVKKAAEGLRLTISLPESADGVAIGDSISINGVCLTVVEKNQQLISFDVIPETLQKTNLSSLKPQEKLNIELSLRPSDRIGGHFVFGHIDGTGSILKKEHDGEYIKIWISASPQLLQQMVQKGAVALDGVSMTLVDVQKDRFSVCVIPHTLSITTLGSKKEGDSLNIEVDMIGKYVRKYLEEMI